MPVNLWVPAMQAVVEKASLTNMIVYQSGGGMEVAGALQAIADLMLQSVTVPGISGETYMALFPLNASFTDLRFTRLRGKGAFVVSAAWSATSGRLDGPVSIESEVPVVRANGCLKEAAAAHPCSACKALDKHMLQERVKNAQLIEAKVDYFECIVCNAEPSASTRESVSSSPSVGR